jgi:hypothetical protein
MSASAKKRRAAEQQRRWEREERERREREEVRALLVEVTAWEDAQRIRSYVKALKRHANADTTATEWALSVADRLDPTKNTSRRSKSLGRSNAEPFADGIHDLALPGRLLGDDD